MEMSPHQGQGTWSVQSKGRISKPQRCGAGGTSFQKSGADSTPWLTGEGTRVQRDGRDLFKVADATRAGVGSAAVQKASLPPR